MSGSFLAPGSGNTRISIKGASEVKTLSATTGAVSTTRKTMITPTSGKKLRIIKVSVFSNNAASVFFEAYFHTGANLTTTPANAVFHQYLQAAANITRKWSETWPDGGGPIGGVDEVLSIRTTGDIGATGYYLVTYREE